MYSNHKKAFTLIESLVGLCLIGWMMSFYLPAFNLALGHCSILKEENQKWHDFVQLIQILHDPMISDETMLESPNLFDLSIVSLDHSSTGWSATFKEGEVYEIQLQAIEPEN